LGFYSAAGLEFAFERLGLFAFVQRLGYAEPYVEIDRVTQGDRLRVWAQADGTKHLLVEAVLEVRAISDAKVLFVHWLSLRNPRAKFSGARPQLPGQEVPGLGLARESAELLALMARRLSLAGVAFCPAWFHTAYSARYRSTFADPKRQARFLALIRDLAELPLGEATQAVAEGRVLLDGKPYQWEPSEMVYWLNPRPDVQRLIDEETAKVRFTWTPRP
jgi:hypothetical protein